MDWGEAKELKINAIQLLAYQAPLSAILLFGIIPFFEPLSGKNGIFYLERSNLEWVKIDFAYLILV